MELEDIKKLANLSRIDMDENEMLTIADSFGSILNYVGQIKDLSSQKDLTKEDVDKNIDDYFLSNVTREDNVTNISGEYTDKIINQMPKHQDGFLKVKQIL